MNIQINSSRNLSHSGSGGPMVWATGEDVRTKPTREQRREGKSEVGMRGKERWWLKNCLLLKEWRRVEREKERESEQERVLRQARSPIITYFNFQICPWLAPPESCRANQVSGIISVVLSSEYKTLWVVWNPPKWGCPVSFKPICEALVCYSIIWDNSPTHS